MGYINIFVSRNATINIKNKQLFLRADSDETSYPVEDINSVMIENLQTIISTYTMSYLAQNNVLVYFCDEKHLPCGCVLPYNNFYKPLEIYQAQVNMPKPLQKQLWQTVIKRKIKNQAAVLKMCCKNNSRVSAYIASVQSADSTNAEGSAANAYFKELFGNTFSRDNEIDINAFLNYGYTIIRSAIARDIVSKGLTPFLGINHKNKLNAFNLADDLIECFRPTVDLYTYEHREDKFDMKHKADLYNLLNHDVMVNNAKYSISYAIQLVVESFVSSILQQKMKLILPEILPLKMHEYE